MKLLLIIFLSLNIYAGDILTSYRLNGIAQIEKEMDLELSKKEYWDKIVENKDTTFGYIESYNNILACDKSVSTLELYSLDENQSFNYRKTYDAFTGKLKGDKLRRVEAQIPLNIVIYPAVSP